MLTTKELDYNVTIEEGFMTMTRRTVALLWIAVAALAFIIFIVGWIMGDVGIKFWGFLVRWILPIVVLVGFGYYRSRIKS